MSKLAYEKAREILLEQVIPVGTEVIATEVSAGRVMADALIAAENVPAFDRSPYDGYAFRSEDSRNAGRDTPVTLRVLEEIPAGTVPKYEITKGTAARVMTGAPIPHGADAVVMYEKTEFTKSEVRIFTPAKPGENVIYAGEDVRKGTVLAPAGSVIDGGLCGSLAAQNKAVVRVYGKPVIGIISTGSELLEPGNDPEPGKIINSNRFTFAAELLKLGCTPVFLGTAGDDPQDICDLIRKGSLNCDGILLTGGVSVGDFDYTPQAMEMAGAELLFHGVDIKPGMACAYGVMRNKEKKILVCGLSGNPASSLTNYHVLAVPALRKLSGRREALWLPEPFPVKLAEGFGKASPGTRFLRGYLDLGDGTACMQISKDQGNVILSSAIGTNVMAVIPAGSGPVVPGSILQAFWL